MKKSRNNIRRAKKSDRRRLSRKGAIRKPVRFSIERKYDNRKAPKNFSVLDNRERVLGYFDDIVRDTRCRKYIAMDLKDIEIIDPLSVSLLIAIMMDSRKESRDSFARHTRVIVPAGNNDPSEIFRKCMFKETVTTGHSDNGVFMSRTDTAVNVRKIMDIIKYADERGIKDAKTVLGPILVEMFSNTNNHAKPSDGSGADYPWYFSVIEKEDKLCFTVIDLGIGIYESLRRNNALKNAPREKFGAMHMYEDKQTRYLSKNIPIGLHSSTDEAHRGKGLKEIYTRANESQTIDKFILITNNATIDMLNINKKVYDYNNTFNGTAYYWEMKK